MSIERNLNQLSYNNRRLSKAFIALLAATALSSCTSNADRPETIYQTPSPVTEDLGTASSSIPKNPEKVEIDIDDSTDFSEFIKSEERSSTINNWVLGFANQLSTAARENSSITSVSSMDNEGNSSIGYFVNSADGSYSFTFEGETSDNELGLVPKSIFADFTPTKGGSEAMEAGNVTLIFNKETNSYDSEYIIMTSNLDGSATILNKFIVNAGGAGVLSSAFGNEGGIGNMSSSTEEAKRIDQVAHDIIQGYIDNAQ